MLISPTIYGNVMLGPTAQDLTDRTDTGTSEAGFAFLLEKGRAIMPALLGEEVTAAYAGLRAATEHSDYVIDVDRSLRYALAGGIRSTGLTAGMAIAEHLVGLLRDAGLELTPEGRPAAAATDAESRRGVHPALPGPGRESRTIPSTGASSASASGSPRVSCAMRSPRPSRRRGWTGSGAVLGP